VLIADEPTAVGRLRFGRAYEREVVLMGLRDALTPKNLGEIDAERLVERFAHLDLRHIGDTEPRARVRVCGEVKRMTIRPRSGIPSTQIVISDGTGDATVVFSGRRKVRGVDHGRCLVVDGVAFEDSDGLTFLNPAYTLLPSNGE
jgi:hypothetical protein